MAKTWPIFSKAEQEKKETTMNQAIVRKVKWFWPWQDDLEETWLEQMSQQGLHLNQTHIPITYDFVQAPSQNYTYRLDFQDSLKPKNKDEYLRLFTDAGWEHWGKWAAGSIFANYPNLGRRVKYLLTQRPKFRNISAS
jgi:hypothetical protein